MFIGHSSSSQVVFGNRYLQYSSALKQCHCKIISLYSRAGMTVLGNGASDCFLVNLVKSFVHGNETLESPLEKRHIFLQIIGYIRQML